MSTPKCPFLHSDDLRGEENPCLSDRDKEKEEGVPKSRGFDEPLRFPLFPDHLILVVVASFLNYEQRRSPLTVKFSVDPRVPISLDTNVVTGSRAHCHVLG